MNVKTNLKQKQIIFNWVIIFQIILKKMLNFKVFNVLIISISAYKIKKKQIQQI